MIVQVTSKQKQDNLSIILSNKDVTEPLPIKSYIRCHKIFVLEQDLIKGKVSRLKKEKYIELITEIKNIIDK